jgi:hypothetical protein
MSKLELELELTSKPMLLPYTMQFSLHLRTQTPLHTKRTLRKMKAKFIKSL